MARRPLVHTARARRDRGRDARRPRRKGRLATRRLGNVDRRQRRKRSPPSVRRLAQSPPRRKHQSEGATRQPRLSGRNPLNPRRRLFRIILSDPSPVISRERLGEGSADSADQASTTDLLFYFCVILSAAKSLP